MNILKTWTELKALVDTKSLKLQYTDQDVEYTVWAGDNGDTYRCAIAKDSPATTDQTDFETNYKDDCNQSVSPKTADGKTFVRAESRPLDMTTMFTGAGDSATVVGGGTPFCWNAALDNDFDTVDSNFKRKVIDFGFKDEICVKEGAIYWTNALWLCELDFWSYIPPGVIDSNKHYVDHFVNRHFFHGDCPMGDELNTECASSKIPSYIRHELWITIPTADDTCKGHISIEIYRASTV